MVRGVCFKIMFREIINCIKWFGWVRIDGICIGILCFIGQDLWV